MEVNHRVNVRENLMRARGVSFGYRPPIIHVMD
jgi:hypothetical protein